MKNLKKELLLLVILIVGLNASAQKFEIDGIYYNIISETGLTCEVTSGDKAYSGSVTIPKTVSFMGKILNVIQIGDYAFKNCSDLTSVIIGSNVNKVGNYAFQNCTSLKKVRIEDGFEELEFGHNGKNYDYYYGIFKDCPLEDIYIGRYLRSRYKYNDNPFGFKKALKTVTIGDSVTSIGSYAFDGCSGLTSLTIPNSVTTIGESAFSGCSGLNEVHISDLKTWCNINFKDSYSNPLYYAHNLYLNNKLITDLVIPDGVKEIKNYAFYDCSGLTSVTIPNSVNSIGTSAFEYCSGLTSVNIPNSVKTIGDYAFGRCCGLTSVNIPNSVTYIGSSAFDGCSGLTSVTIPNSVTSIGDWAFYDCSDLTSVTIGNSVTAIGYFAFSDCKVLTEINSLNPVPPTLNISNYGNFAFDNAHYESATLNVPKGSLDAYKQALGWKKFLNIQESDFGGVEAVESDEVKVFAYGNMITVVGAEETAVVEVFNLNGQLICRGFGNEFEVAAGGIYIVRIAGKTYKVAAM